MRRYQLHLAASGVGVPTINQTVSTLRFFFKVTLKRHDIVEHTHVIHELRKLDLAIRRFLIHVLPKGLHRIRHYGLFAKGSSADNIAQARELLAVAKPEGQPTAATVDPSKPSCLCCGGRMIIIEVFERGCTPRHQPTAPTNRIRIDTS